MSFASRRIATSALAALLWCGPSLADPSTTWTAEQDHRNLMDQLGIEALRPGPSGDETAPDHANYDEAKAGPVSEIPDPLTLDDGRKVTSAEQWRKLRRPEIVEAFEREVYGRVPADAPKVTWTVQAVDREFVGFTPVVAKKLVGHLDNSADPAIEVNIRMVLVTPAAAKGPVPVLMMLGRAAFPAPAQPSQEELDRINAAAKALLVEKDPSLKAVFEAHPAYEPVPAQGFAMPPPNADGDPASTLQLLADGWGFALIDPLSVQADSGSGLTRGVIGLANHGRPRKPDDWGALRAWAWGASRGLDYLQTDPAVDPRRVGVEGVSRYGKAALVAMAFDERFAAVLVGSSGEGGAKLHRRNFGEAVETLTSTGEYHWMAGNFLKYGAAKARFAARSAADLPVDAHELIALCAPRPTFISYGVPSAGDARWLDQRGSWMATVAAQPVFRLLGAKDLGVGDDWRSTPMPPVNTGLLDGTLAWRQHDGGHTDAPNIKWFLRWADRQLGRSAPGA